MENTNKNFANIAVFVSGGGTNLQALIDAEKKQLIPYGKLALVVSSNASAYAIERAKKADIKTEVVAKKNFETQKTFEDALKNVLSQYKIDLIVLAGFMSILSEDFVVSYSNRIINVHPSLIPSFCGKGFYGLKVHEAVLEKGVKVTGATVHYVNEIPDGGKIILQKAVDVMDTDTPEILQQRVMQQAEWIILPKAVDKVTRKIVLEEK